MTKKKTASAAVGKVKSKERSSEISLEAAGESKETSRRPNTPAHGNDPVRSAMSTIYRPRKQLISLRLDRDVIAWFKAKGKGYQTHMDIVLRMAMIEEIGIPQGDKKQFEK